ncbi:isoquinoline 1-oxidoreductase, alpha subunit [Cupriavidus sp. OV038]|jgi:isoquinoline 1-oxidoreductase alpha subunit|uniref:(2Fe-2S)-binding protein n=1 Tax=unclassified Cupriavidus TaxID=2640874 RepID=UPI0008EA7D4D|nr:MULTISPECIES: (2Fe-2S)-binding protein [unclassified Cupriavidus]SFC12846.1 isoquinoline 1-oxidoreductase, alpha subunit [Cupriavidus sp. OV038]SFP08585.1 isoquinoline 1-oxidoreductase, alpha subunit [Cupriavidus sp. OV096]
MDFVLNGKATRFDGDGDTPLLWVIRDDAGLTGTKYGCGIGACGACTVHVDGNAQRSCVTPVSSVAGRKVTTIEGLSPDRSSKVQQAWIAKDVPQCGYCQSGMVMAVTALLKQNPHPTDKEIDASVSNLCRCATYHRIREAVHAAAK